MIQGTGVLLWRILPVSHWMCMSRKSDISSSFISRMLMSIWLPFWIELIRHSNIPIILYSLNPYSVEHWSIVSFVLTVVRYVTVKYPSQISVWKWRTYSVLKTHWNDLVRVKVLMVRLWYWFWSSDYRCSVCGEKVTVQKSQTLHSLPPYLIIHQKRFDFDYNSFTKTKLYSPFSFPMQMEL